ncbi:MAG: DbpA RNA binding domain-containing protein [Gemmatimonadaceae bacterium]|nr:DbpA RNA binding domain-containing protein [Gemmatimonadaceae bacterium]
MARLYVGAGRLARVRPGDLVGAIANELQLDASVVGAIQIQDKFSIVEVPDEIADDIIDALRNTTIKGKRVIVRRDRRSVLRRRGTATASQGRYAPREGANCRKTADC